MRSCVAWFGLCLACAFALPARAGESRGIVAILPFDYRQAKLSDAEKTLLEESVRTAAGEKLAPAGYTVLTTESTLAFLQDNAIDPAKVCDANCSLTAARELKATLFLSGAVATADGVHVAFIRMFETAKGAVIASEQMSGANILDIRKKFLERRQAFFDKALAAMGVPVPQAAQTAQAAHPTPAPALAPPEAAPPAPAPPDSQPVPAPPEPVAVSDNTVIPLPPPPPESTALPVEAVSPTWHASRRSLHSVGVAGIVVGSLAMAVGGVVYAVAQGQIGSAQRTPSSNVPAEVGSINGLVSGAVALFTIGGALTVTGVGLTAAF
jgi:hypothetical protein